jgi:protein O-mannosyl-transferase
MASVPQSQFSGVRAAVASQLQRPWIALLFVAGITFVVYYSTLSFDFVWDDVPQIVDNPLIRSWHSIARVFFSDLWFHIGRSQIYYRPLFVLWAILNFKIFGLHPWGWHLTTVLLHLAATCSVYFLARTLKFDHWTASLSALLFGLHPIHIECAAWISAGSDSLVTVFYLLAFIGFLKSGDQDTANNRPWRIASFFALLCALFTKEMAVTFPLLVTLYLWLRTKREHGKRLVELWHSLRTAAPYFVITLSYLILRKLALHRPTKLDPSHTSLDVLLTLPSVLFAYLRLLIFPSGLTGLYYSTYAVPPGFWNFVFPLLALCVFAAIILYWTKRANDPIVGFSALWMIVGIIPVLYLRALPAGGAVRDRYLYLPSVGFVLLLAKAIRLLRFSDEERKSARLRWLVTGAICLACIAGVLNQQIYWANDLLLFYRGYVLYPQNIDGTMELASALMKRNDYGRALPILTNLTHDHPQVGPPHYYLAQAYIHLGQKAEAQRALDTALELAPDVMQSSAGKSDVATLLAQLGDYDKALNLYLEVLREEPDLYSANYNGGYTYFLLRQDAEAEKLLQHAVQVAPGIPAPIFYLGRIYLRAGDAPRAQNYFRTALTLDSKGYDYHYWLGQALAATGQQGEAKDEYLEELRLHPENPNAIAQLNPSLITQQPRATKQ